MQYISVRAIASRLKSQFKVDMDIFDVVAACRDALDKMGTIALGRVIYQATVNNYCINMPGTVWRVRGVIRLDEPEVKPGINVVPSDIYFPPQIMFEFPEPDAPAEEVIFLKTNYAPQFKGPYIDYTWTCPLLKFNETDIPVAIETTALKTDSEKYPMVPQECFFGCLYYALYVYYQPLYLLKQIDGNMMQQVEAWKERNIAQSNQSALMAALTANERDNLMNIMTSFDRKAFSLPS